MKKWIAPIAGLICLAVCVAVLLFSCNGSEKNDTKPTEGPTTPAVTTSVEGTTIPVTTPAETTLPVTTPVETTPAVTTPVETTPPETTPVPTQPSGGSSPGGTGGFEGGSTGGTTPQPKPEEEIVVPEPGTPGNPFAERIGQLPDGFATFAIPAGGSITYRVAGLAGNQLTVSDADASVTLGDTTYDAVEGVVTVAVPYADKSVTLTVTNKGAEEKAFTLEVMPPVGSENNPEEIQDITQLEPVFGPGKTQHYYRYVPAEPGVLTLACTGVTPENAVVTIEMTDAAGASTTDETGTHMDVIAGQEVIICVSVEGAEDASAKLTGTFDANLGTLSNPIPILNVEDPFTATVPGESTVYYSGNLHEMTLHMLNCEDVVLVIGEEEVSLDGDGNIIHTFPAADGMGRPQPIVFGLKNTSDTETDYTLTFTYPLGSVMNPAQLILGDNTATIRPDNMDGYNYAWTAEKDGILIISMQGDNWQYIVNNLTQGVYGEIMDASMEPSVAELILEVSQGDEISLSVNGFDPADVWALPGGTVSFSANLTAKPGSRDNPIAISDLSQSFVTTIPAETTYYYTGLLYDVDMESYDAYGLELSTTEDDAYDENGYFFYHFPAYEGVGRPQPITFCLSNATGEDATYTLNFIFPAGSSQNPAELLLGENVAPLAADNAEGYIYNWTATGNGELTVAMEGTGWSYTVSNLTSGTYGDTHLSDDETLVPSETIQVSEGDVIQVVVNTYDPESFSTPAGSVTFTASFVEPDLGTEANPEEVMGQFPIDTHKMLPGTSYYYDVYGCSGMIIRTDATITVNGEAYDGSVLNVGRGEAVRLAVINDTHTSNRFLIYFEFPEGHPENPAQLVIGSNQGAVQAGNTDGYNYIYTAEENGLLTVTMQGMDAWQYQLNNDTAGVYGDLHLSDEDPQVASQTMAVSAGDVVRLMVNTYDPADAWNAPAGDIAFAASFVAEGSSKQVPIEVRGQFPIETGTMAPEQTLYYTVYNCNGMAISTDAVITVNGEAYNGETISTMRGQGIDLVVYNHTGEESAFTLEFAAPKGSFMNPAKLNIGANTASLASGNSDGYLYEWTASADGTLVIAMKGGAWQYVLSNESAGKVGDLLDSTGPENAVAKLEVKKGQVISLNVNAFDPAEPYGYPGGKVSFTASFYENEVVVTTLAKGTESGKEVALETGALEHGGQVYLAVSSVADKASGKKVAYTVNGEGADGSAMYIAAASAETQWALAQESGEEVEVSYALVYVYEIIPEPETTEPEAAEPETTGPEVTQPEPTEPETTEPPKAGELPQPEETSEPTEPQATEPEASQPTEDPAQ